MPRVSHKTLHAGLISMQPFGLATPEACKYVSPGYAPFAYPGLTFEARNAPRSGCEAFSVLLISLPYIVLIRM